MIELDFSKRAPAGLVTVVTQDDDTGEVLMVAHADREAIDRTLATGEMHYRSRARGAWHKGATSGNVQRLVSLTADCDGDAVLARVRPTGPACHTGSTSCFGNEVSVSVGVREQSERTAASDAPAPPDPLSALDAVIAERATAPVVTGAGYTQRLLGDRNLRLKKLGEEASELVTACADGDAGRATEETADLIYHALVALHACGGSLAGVRRVLAERATV